MKPITFVCLVFSLLCSSAALADRPTGATSDLPEAMAVDIAFSSTVDLRDDGWKEIEPDVWRKTLASGAEAEVALGFPAVDRLRVRLDVTISELRRSGHLTHRQQLRLEDLLAQRAELDQVDPLFYDLCDQPVCGLCTGTAVFNQSLRYQDFATPFIESDTSFYHASSVGSANAIAEATICPVPSNPSNICPTDRKSVYGDSSITAIAKAVTNTPTFGCVGDSFGSVYVYGSGVPSHCRRIAVFSIDWEC